MKIEIPGVKVRKMQEADLRAVLEIDRQSFSLPWSERTYRYELRHNQASRLLVATTTGSSPGVVGYLGFWLMSEQAHISTFAVDPAYRRQGIGRLLLQAGIKLARSMGASVISLEVRVSNDAAIRLYDQFAFEAVATKEAYYRDNEEDALVMVLHTEGDRGGRW